MECLKVQQLCQELSLLSFLMELKIYKKNDFLFLQSMLSCSDPPIIFFLKCPQDFHLQIMEAQIIPSL